MAQTLARTSALDEPQARRVAALLRAARLCDPGEVRYPRLEADLLLQLRADTQALEALAAVRRLAPGDLLAQIDTIDLHVRGMETVERKVEYLRQVIAREVVNAEVRSTAAVRLAGLLEEQGRRNEAAEALARAVALNPLNFTALAMQYERLPESAPVPQRVALLVAMIRANPAVPPALQQLGRYLASEGMVSESLTWFNHAVNVANQNRAGLTVEMLTDLATANILAEKYAPAQEALDRVLAADKGDYPALILRALLETRQGKAESAREFRTRARNTLVNRLNTLRNQMGAKDATTRPIDEGEIFLPNLRGDQELVDQIKNAQLRPAHLQALGDLAWFQVFLNERPAEAQSLMQTLDELLRPAERESATFLPRLAGWIALKQNRLDEAKVKLSAVAERDPLAMLGLIRCLPPAEARSQAQKLLDANGYGIPAVLLADNVRDLGIRHQPSERAGAMTAVLESLPKGWMNILTRPADFYAMGGTPVRISVPFGEPMLAKFSIQNTSNVDLTVGADGVIRPGIWFDAQVGGIFQQSLPGVAFERLTEVLVLRPRQTVEITVRIDQNDLAALLRQRPAAPVSFKVTARTNPLVLQSSITSGPAGYFVELSRPLERAAYQITAESLAATIRQVSAGTGGQRIRALDLLSLLLRDLQAKDDPVSRQRVADVVDALDRAREQTDPLVRAWAMLAWINAAPADQKTSAALRMVDAAQSWQCRLLGLLALEAVNLPVERHKAIVQAMAREEGAEACLRQFAGATLTILEKPAAPATPGRP
jgi:tetratricopeptide (TPR) repeat protein